MTKWAFSLKFEGSLLVDRLPFSVAECWGGMILLLMHVYLFSTFPKKYFHSVTKNKEYYSWEHFQQSKPVKNPYEREIAIKQ